MPNDITGTHHGLSVLTTAAAAQRLQWPVSTDVPLSTTFNDASSGSDYPQKAGHEGIDFACSIGVEVHAMYGGTVVDVQENHGYYGKLVTIQSFTDWANKAGFEHTYGIAGMGQGSEGCPDLGIPIARGAAWADCAMPVPVCSGW